MVIWHVLNEVFKEIFYDFMDVDILSSLDRIPRHLKPITSPFLVLKYDGGIKTVKL